MSKSLPLREAYKFGFERGLESEIQKIRTLNVPKSGYRRGYILQLFRDNNCLDEFIQHCWPNGLAQEGERRLKIYEKFYIEHSEEEISDSNDQADDETEQSFAFEAQLRDYLAHNLSIIEPGLRLYENDGINGIEFSVEGGRIDILAVDQDSKLVVIELKLSKGRNKALGQLLYYMGWADKNHSSRPCRGIIVAENISEELKTAVLRVPGVSLYEYKVSMTVEKVRPD